MHWASAKTGLPCETSNPHRLQAIGLYCLLRLFYPYQPLWFDFQYHRCSKQMHIKIIHGSAVHISTWYIIQSKRPKAHLYIKTTCLRRPHFTGPQLDTFHVIEPAYKDHLLCIRTTFCWSLGRSLYTSFTVQSTFLWGNRKILNVFNISHDTTTFISAAEVDTTTSRGQSTMRYSKS